MRTFVSEYGEIMNMKRAALLVTAGVAFAVPAVPAVAQYNSLVAAPSTRIDCPLRESRREVTTPLPAGWWNTPYIDKLKSTYVQNVGGSPTLMCDYGNGGIIMHLAPAGMMCQPAGQAFVCMSGQKQ